VVHYVRHLIDLRDTAAGAALRIKLAAASPP
jgi:hypothetical protein